MKNVPQKLREVWWREGVRDLRGPLWRKDSVTYGRGGEENMEKWQEEREEKEIRGKKTMKRNFTWRTRLIPLSSLTIVF